MASGALPMGGGEAWPFRRALRRVPFFDRWMAWSLAHPLSPLARALLPVVLTSAAATVRALFIPDLLPWLLFIPCVLLTGLAAGLPAALLGAVLSTVMGGYSLSSARVPHWLTFQQWTASGIFFVVALWLATLAAELRAAFARAHRLAAEAAAANRLLTEREEQLELLNGELGHRLKNQLSIVQAVAGQTMRGATDLREASAALSARLAALGRATDVLTRTEWNPADLHDLARAAVAAHGDPGPRFLTDGPAIRFGPQVGLALTLALHELMTNAVKYGALSNETGRVELRWQVAAGGGAARPGDGAANGPNVAEPRFLLTWQEFGGPEVRPPTRRGFGSLMIERSLRSYFRGHTALDFAPAGLVFTIDAPLGDAQEVG